MNNGVILYDGVVPGSVAHLACDKGYAASEIRDRTCLCNGLWSGKIQICVELGEVICIHTMAVDLNHEFK